MAKGPSPEELRLLYDLQALQSQVRALEQETIVDEFLTPESGAHHIGYAKDGTPISDDGAYGDLTTTSKQKGEILATSGNKSPGGIVWADSEKARQQPNFVELPCANGVNCLDENFCYDTRDCPDCEVCRNYTCVEPDPNETCNSDRDCPCDPGDGQTWDCVNGACLLTCRTNSDCGLLGRAADQEDQQCFACNPNTGYCGPGCQKDFDCTARGDAADKRPGSFCIDCECKTPCEAPEFCSEDKDCKPNRDGTPRICEEHSGRTESDGAANTGYACVDGCRSTIQCPVNEFIDEDGLLWKQQLYCVDGNCEVLCSKDDECFPGDSCVDSECVTLGALCVSDDDCEQGDVCGPEGRCTSGCRSNAECVEKARCKKEQSCVDECQYDQSCFCSNCDPDDWSWIENCPKDPLCVDRCPDEEGCEPPTGEQICYQQKCVSSCRSSVDCPGGGKGYTCSLPVGYCTSSGDCQDGEVCGSDNQCEPEEDGPPNPCEDFRRLRRNMARSSVPPPKECRKLKSDEDGPIDEAFGCESGECCDQAGQCARCVCVTDADCQGGYLCVEGFCEPGCDDNENKCPQGQCCGPDQKCHLTCSTDSNCPNPEMCLAGGCCGIACEPLVHCNSSSDCKEGQYCDGDNYCQDGCAKDSDCEEDEICFQFSCAFACQDTKGCNLGGECESQEDCASWESCQEYNGKTYCIGPPSTWDQVCNENGYCDSNPPVCCFNDGDCSKGFDKDENGNVTRTYSRTCQDGQCQEGCRRDSDCPSNLSCTDGQCGRPCYMESDCKVLGSSWTCSEDSAAYRQQLREVAKCNKDVDEKQASGLYDPRTIAGLRQKCRDMKDEIEENRAEGFCRQVNADAPPGDQGRTGCECFEECDEVGRCNPIICEIDQDCPCGSCLADSSCGECYTDDDCQGRKKCDRAQICDDNGENCVDDPEQGGVCVYSCLPPEPCASNEDCPEDTFCGRPSGAEPGDDLACLRGCRDDSGCPPGLKCDGGRCAPACSSPDDCNTDYETCGAGGFCVYVGWSCADDGDCPPDLGLCQGGKCAPDNRCEDDSDCGSGGECANGFCSNANSEDPYDEAALFDPEVASDMGCESCAECCNSKFQCERCPCERHADCPCGVCAGDRRCLEECATNADCLEGYCKKGDCVECLQDSHCWSKYPAAEDGEIRQQLQCSPNNTCETPCFTGLSTGSCFDGLLPGDTCENCPDKCPEGAECRMVPDKVCNLAKTWDPSIGDNGDWKYTPVLCQECFLPCSAACDCPDGFACLNGGCVQASGKCVTSADCPCDEPDCRLGRCRTVGDDCIAASDCEPQEDADGNTIPQICDFGVCKEGVCSEEYPCQQGQTCVEGFCFPSCDDAYLACGITTEYNDDGLEIVKEVTCPPGYVCDVDRCTSPDYLGLGDTMGCGEGKFCDRGGCVPIDYGTYECSNDDDCNEPAKRAAYMSCRQQWKGQSAEINRCVREKLDQIGRVCDERLCRKRTGADDADNNEGRGDGRDQEQDSCEPIGKCCGDDGFCENCLCDEEHPCEGPNECCDADTGKCLHVDEHDNTRFGEPGCCQYDKVYCKLLDCEENEVVPTEDFNDPTVPGCEQEERCWWDPREAKEVCEKEKRCWDGNPLNDEQIIQELEKLCDPEDEKCEDGCTDEDMPPEENECYYDFDCAQCQECVSKFWRSTECCPLASTLIDGEGNETEIDGIYRNICEARYEEGSADAEKYCRCESDDDCTECEYCRKSDNPGGQGGSNLITGDEPFGQCVLACDKCPCGGDSTFKKGACPSCSERLGNCAVESTTTLREEYVDPVEGIVVPAETACACVVNKESDCCEAYDTIDDIKNSQLVSGCIRKEYVDQNGINRVLQVAKCRDDEEGICCQCENDSDCAGSQECHGCVCISQCGQEDSADGGDDKPSFGWDKQDCSCCTDDYTCRELYESWTESKNGAGGQICRPCTCTENGIDCADFLNCESCYKWVRKDNSSPGEPDDQLAEAKKKVQTFGLEQALFEAQMKETEAFEAKDAAEEELVEAMAGREYWLSQVEFCQDICEEEFGQLPPECTPQVQRDCIKAEQNYNAAQGEVTRLEGVIDQAESDAYLAALDQAKIADKLSGQNFTYGGWVQERQCDCCVDGQCRSDEDCTYGTCYLCIAKDRGDGKSGWTGWYGVGIWGKVLQNPVCMGMNSGYTSYGGWDNPEEASSCPCYECPDPGGDNAPGPLCGNTCERSTGGPQFVTYKLDHGVDACIKYRCRDGIFTEERLGSGKQNRYYEYCTGSIIGCLIGGDSCRGDACCIAREYMNGWQFEYDTTEAGTFYGNATLPEEDWIRLAGIPESQQKAECMYPNRLGHVRGHELPTFEDMLAGHPCCNKGEFWYQCHPEHPGCQTILEVLFEPGDVSGLIKRLTEEANALCQEIATASYIWWLLDDEIEKIQDDIDEIIDESEKLAREYNQKKGELDQKRRDKEQLEEDLEDKDEEINGEKCGSDGENDYGGCANGNDCSNKDPDCSTCVAEGVGNCGCKTVRVPICEEICEEQEPECREVCEEFQTCRPVFNPDTNKFEDECEIEENCREVCDEPEIICRTECNGYEDEYRDSPSNGLACKADHYMDVFKEQQEIQKELIEIRDEVEAARKEAGDLADMYKENYENAKALVKKVDQEIKQLQAAIERKEAEYDANDCDGEGAGSLVCTNIDLELNAPGGLYEQLADKESEKEDYTSQQNLWYDAWQEQKKIYEDMEEDVEEAQEDVDEATEDLQTAFGDAIEAKEELDEAKVELGEINSELKTVNQEIVVLEEELEELAKKIDVCIERPCEDGYGNTIAGCWVKECTEGELTQQVKNLEELKEGYEAEQDSLCGGTPAEPVGTMVSCEKKDHSCSVGLIADLLNERQELVDQIERLKEQDELPVKPEIVYGRPETAKTSKELRDAYKEQIERDKEASENEWYPE